MWENTISCVPILKIFIIPFFKLTHRKSNKESGQKQKAKVKLHLKVLLWKFNSKLGLQKFLSDDYYVWVLQSLKPPFLVLMSTIKVDRKGFMGRYWVLLPSLMPLEMLSLTALKRLLSHFGHKIGSLGSLERSKFYVFGNFCDGWMSRMPRSIFCAGKGKWIKSTSITELYSSCVWCIEIY